MSPLEATLEPLRHSPRLPDIVEALQTQLGDEALRRQKFYQDMSDDQKMEFIDGAVVLHSPGRNRHLMAKAHLVKLLNTYVPLHQLGAVRDEKCLCVFPRNDYEPDIVFFGPKKAAAFGPETMKFPVPDFAVEILSESTEGRDRGVKFEDFAAHGVAEYWIIDAELETVEQYLQRGEVFELALKSGGGFVASTVIAGFGIPIRAIFDEAENLAALRGLLG